MENISIIIPAYNEEDSIELVIQSVKKSLDGKYNYELIIVDDASTDATGKIASESRAYVITHEVNRGYGASLKTGLKHASNEVIAIIDADNTYPAEELPRLILFMGEYDMVVGSRTGDVVKIPLIRKPAKWILSKVANILTRVNIPDLNSGFRIFKKSVVNKYIHILPDGFSFTTTITIAMLCDGYSVKYVPINYYERIGKSKIKSIKDTYDFFVLILRSILYFEPLRIFLPLTMGLLFSSFLLLLHDIIFKHSVTKSTLLITITSLQIGVLGLIADLIVKSRKGSNS